MTIKLEHSLTPDSPWKQATLKVNGTTIEWNAPIFLFRGQANEVTVQVPSLIAKRLRLDWLAGGGLQLEASPKFGDWVEPNIDGLFRWTVTPADGKSGRVSLAFFSHEVDTHWKLSCGVMSATMADEVATVLFDGEPYASRGQFFVRGKSRTFTMLLKADSPLLGHPFTLKWLIVNGLEADDLVSQPAFDTAQTTYNWAITGSNRSGKFTLSLHAEGITGAYYRVENYLLSTVLADDYEPRLNNLPLPEDLSLDGQSFELSLHPKENYIKKFPVALKFISGANIEKHEFRVMPSFDYYNMDVSGVHRWRVEANVDHNATFQLGFQSGISGIETLIVPFKLSLFPDIVFSGQSVSAGSELLAVRGRRHVIRINTTSPIYNGTRVKVELVGDATLGDITPASWLVMDPAAEFIFNENDKDGEFELKITFEKSPSKPVLAKVLLRSVELEIIEVVPDRDKFFHNELGYFNVKISAKGHPEISLKDAIVGAAMLGVDINHSYTDEHGWGTIMVKLPAGEYILKPFVRWERAEPQRYQDVPFTVHNK